MISIAWPDATMTLITRDSLLKYEISISSLIVLRIEKVHLCGLGNTAADDTYSSFQEFQFTQAYMYLQFRPNLISQSRADLKKTPD